VQDRSGRRLARGVRQGAGDRDAFFELPGAFRQLEHELRQSGRREVDLLAKRGVADHVDRDRMLAWREPQRERPGAIGFGDHRLMLDMDHDLGERALRARVHDLAGEARRLRARRGPAAEHHRGCQNENGLTRHGSTSRRAVMHPLCQRRHRDEAPPGSDERRIFDNILSYRQCVVSF
jgi:hypothetical protein